MQPVTALGVVIAAALILSGLALVILTVMWGAADPRLVKLSRANLALVLGAVGVVLLEGRSWQVGGWVLVGNPVPVLGAVVANGALLFAQVRLGLAQKNRN